MGMSDKQYNGMLLDLTEDFEEIVALIPDCPEKEVIVLWQIAASVLVKILLMRACKIFQPPFIQQSDQL